MTSLDDLRSAAAEQAALLGSAFVGSEHLFLAWLVAGTGPAHEAVLAAGVTPEQFTTLIAARAASGRAQSAAGENGLSSHAQKVMAAAEEMAAVDGRSGADGDDLFLALIREPRGAVARALTEGRLKPGQLRNLIRPNAPRAKQAKREPKVSIQPADAVATPPATAPRERPAKERPPKEQRPKTPKRDAEIDDIPEARAPERPRLSAPPKPSPLPPPVSPTISTRRWSWLWILYLGVPISIALHFTGGDPTIIFVASCLGIVPLAGAMATATDHLAERTGPVIGGLVNATFGNATEIIVAVLALNAGYIDLVKASLAGSILGNLLLILGLAFIAGGREARTLRFDRTAAGVSGVMLALAVAGLVLPSMFGPLIGVEHLRPLSQFVSIVLMATYLLSLLFTFRTHRVVFGHVSVDEGGRVWPVALALGVLALAVVGVLVESELLVQTIGQVTTSWHLSPLFLGLIVIPVIGNAAEHATAVIAARRGKTELAVQIAIGSSTQVALLVAPLLVLGSVFLGHSMDLVFPAFQIVTLAIGVIVSALITLDGESHWFEGVQLVALYLMIAAAAWFI